MATSKLTGALCRQIVVPTAAVAASFVASRRSDSQVTQPNVQPNLQPNPRCRCRRGRAQEVLCQSTTASPATPASSSVKSFVECLRTETAILLARGAVPLPTVATGASAAVSLAKSEKRSSSSVLESAPEMRALFASVEALAAAVDVLVLTETEARSPPSTVAMLRVRAAYSAFTAALSDVEAAAFGPYARPLAETFSWAPLLQRWRYHVCSLFSWGVLPEDVALEAACVLSGLGALGLVDPLAGSGWHARLFGDGFGPGFSVVAMDAYPVRPVAWAPVTVVADARRASQWGTGEASLDRWALLLSWPPHSPETVGVDLLRSWPGDFLVYFGERGDEGVGATEDMSVDGDGLTGGRDLLEAIRSGWEPVRRWRIPVWPGYGDDLTIYRRKAAPE